MCHRRLLNVVTDGRIKQEKHVLAGAGNERSTNVFELVRIRALKLWGFMSVTDIIIYRVLV